MFVNWPLFWPDQNPLKFGVYQIIWVFFILGRPDTWFPLAWQFLQSGFRQQIQPPVLLEHFPENPWPRQENSALGNARQGKAALTHSSAQIWQGSPASNPCSGCHRQNVIPEQRRWKEHQEPLQPALKLSTLFFSCYFLRVWFLS